MNDLTTKDLQILWELAEDYADWFDEDEELHATYTALAEKLGTIIKNKEAA